MGRVFHAICLAAVLAISADIAPAATVFNYSGAPEAYVVPVGVTSLKVSMWGGGGAGNASSASGNSGAYVTGILAVTPGQTLYIVVGGGGGQPNSGLGTGGTGGFGGGGNGGNKGAGTGINMAGGGGGGFSAILDQNIFSSPDVIALAAGGGGGGGIGNGSAPANGQIAGVSLFGGNGGNGGNGGQGGIGSQTGQTGSAGAGGGGAAGGFNGGPAGSPGGNGSPGTPGSFGPPPPGTPGGPGGPGTSGTNGGAAGSLTSSANFTSGALSFNTSTGPAGTSDPNYLSTAAGSGGFGSTPGSVGRVVFDAVPEPSLACMLCGPALMLLRRRRRSACASLH